MSIRYQFSPSVNSGCKCLKGAKCRSDESHHNIGRFRGISMISLKSEHRELINKSKLGEKQARGEKRPPRNGTGYHPHFVEYQRTGQ
jgi:hypothetical protein